MDESRDSSGNREYIDERDEMGDKIVSDISLKLEPEKARRDEEEFVQEQEEVEKSEKNELEELEIVDDRIRKFTEKELKDRPLSEEEIERIPLRITNPFLQFYFGFIYAFLGIYYVFKFQLYRYMMIEGSFCVTLFTITISFTIITSLIISLGSTLEFFIPIALWVLDLIVKLLISRGMERTSYIFEHRLKGSEYAFWYCCGDIKGEDDGKSCVESCAECCCVNCLDICADVTTKIIRQLLLLIIAPILSSVLLGVAFPFLVPVYVILIVWIYSFNFGFSAIEPGLLSRKYKTVWERIMWSFRHHNIVVGYGFASLILYVCPFVHIVFYLHPSIGATRLFLHLEEKRKTQDNLRE